MMEKDNKKARDDARRDYNDTVRVSVYINRSNNASLNSMLSLSLNSSESEILVTRLTLRVKRLLEPELQVLRPLLPL